MSKYVKLTTAQKDEIRRLTQFANRRIRSAAKEYGKAGLRILPKEVVAHLQHKSMWHTEKNPLSRSVKFESKKDYQKHLHFLRRFEYNRPSIHEYKEIEKNKTLQAMETSLGVEIPKAIQEKVAKMNPKELNKFWDKFNARATRMGMLYSSDAAMTAMYGEYFESDAKDFFNLLQQE